MTAVTARDLQPFQSADVRVFVQRYKANPLNGFDYWGRYAFEDIGMRSRGEPDRVRAPSDDRRRSWVTVDTTVKDVETQTASLMGSADRELKEPIHEMFDLDEEFAMQVVIGTSTSPQSLGQYDSKLVCTSCHFIEDNPLAAEVNVRDGDDNESFTLEASVYYDDTIIINKLNMVEVATGLTMREILDSQVRFVSAEDGYRWYMLSTNVATTDPSAIIYGKGRRTITWATYEPAALSTDGKGDRLYIIGDYLVFTGSADDTHYYSLLSDVDAGSDTFTAVTGYTASSGPVAMFARSAADIIAVGLGGYIYNLTGVTKAPSVVDAGSITSQNLNDVHGFGKVVVAVGASNALVKSADGGRTFAAVTGPSVGVALTAVWCISETEWWVGNASGGLYFTEDSGATWNTISIETGVDEIHQIRFANRYVGYIAAEASAASVKGRLYRTTDCGATWRKGAPELANAPSALVDMNTVAVAHTNLALGAGIGASNGEAYMAS